MADIAESKIHYMVLFTSVIRQWHVSESIRRNLPEDKGIVFYPCVELWIRSLDENVIEPLFPGYLFIRSELPLEELHEYIKQQRYEITSFIRELRVGMGISDYNEPFLEDMIDLSDEEAELLDFLMGFKYENESLSPDEESAPDKGYIDIKAHKAKNGKLIHRRRFPGRGVLGMSRGYKDSDGSYVVMEGPLRGQGDLIVKANPKERRAYLDFKVGGKNARVGFELKSRKHWFPEDENETVVLEDGFEFQTLDVADSMMRQNS